MAHLDQRQNLVYFSYECDKCGNLRTWGNSTDDKFTAPANQKPMLLCECRRNYVSHTYIGNWNRGIPRSQKMAEFLAKVAWGGAELPPLRLG